MNEIVKLENGKAVTTSLLVADKFGKRHDTILRAIRNIECPENFRLHNFAESSYSNEQGKEQPMYVLTRDGFTFLAMGFTGKKAAAWKIQYLEAFNAMESALLRQQNLSWQQARLDGKTARRELTDVVAQFVEYATAQGSHNSRLYFQNITRMTYKALFLVKEASPKPFRDLLDSMQLSFLSAAEHVCKAALNEGMEQGLHYKLIYQSARDKVCAYAATLPTTKLLAA